MWIYIPRCMFYTYWFAIQRNSIHKGNGIRCGDLVWKAHKSIWLKFTRFFVFWNEDSFQWPSLRIKKKTVNGSQYKNNKWIEIRNLRQFLAEVLESYRYLQKEFPDDFLCYTFFKISYKQAAFISFDKRSHSLNSNDKIKQTGRKYQRWSSAMLELVSRLKARSSVITLTTLCKLHVLFNGVGYHLTTEKICFEGQPVELQGIWIIFERTCSSTPW